jgi:hypothetical protein
MAIEASRTAAPPVGSGQLRRVVMGVSCPGTAVVATSSPSGRGAMLVVVIMDPAVFVTCCQTRWPAEAGLPLPSDCQEIKRRSTGTFPCPPASDPKTSRQAL